MEDPVKSDAGTPAPPAPPAKPSPPPEPWWLELIRTWGPAILAVVLIRTFVFEPFRIPSGSMVPTLLIGDHVVVTKSSYGIWLPFADFELLDLGDPSRGDIIVFRYPNDESIHYIKRVVAIGGDRISVRDNQVILNGVPQPRQRLGRYDFQDQGCDQRPTTLYDEDLSGLRHAVLTNMGLGGPLSDRDEVIIPPNRVFVMGDNRDNSEDSRKWGTVRFDQIKGKAHLIWLSLDACAGAPAEGPEGGVMGTVGSVRNMRTERLFQNLYSAPLPPISGP